MFTYYRPITEFDRLFEDTLATRACPRARAPSTEARHTTTRRRDVFRPRFIQLCLGILIFTESFLSRLDVYESKDTNTVTATLELPGWTSDGVAIDVHQNRLTVSGEAPAPDSSEEEKSYVVHERRGGKFSRTLQLPFGTKVSWSSFYLLNG